MIFHLAALLHYSSIDNSNDSIHNKGAKAKGEHSRIEYISGAHILGVPIDFHWMLHPNYFISFYY